MQISVALFLCCFHTLPVLLSLDCGLPNRLARWGLIVYDSSPAFSFLQTSRSAVLSNHLLVSPPAHLLPLPVLLPAQSPSFVVRHTVMSLSVRVFILFRTFFTAPTSRIMSPALLSASRPACLGSSVSQTRMYIPLPLRGVWHGMLSRPTAQN